MPKHLSLGTVAEKNKIASTNVFLVLAEIEVVDDTGVLVETIRLVKNNEDISYFGEVYTAAAFDFEQVETSEGIPEVRVAIADPTQTVLAKCEEYGGGVGWKVRTKVVNSGDLTVPAEIEDLYYILASNAKDYACELTLGANNPLRQRFPRTMQWRDNCNWVFKSPECGYDGADTFCDYTLQGPDGCGSRNNTMRFRALPGLRPR